MSEVVVNDDNFEEEVIKSGIPVLVDFWAEWCVPCRMISPLLEEIAAEYDGKVKVAKCNVDESPSRGTEYNIHSIPTLMVFFKGKTVVKKVGVMPKEAIVEMFGDLI